MRPDCLIEFEAPHAVELDEKKKKRVPQETRSVELGANSSDRARAQQSVVC